MGSARNRSTSPTLPVTFPGLAPRSAPLEVVRSYHWQQETSPEPRRQKETPRVETTRLAGEYALPVAAPDLVGDRPEVDCCPRLPAGLSPLSERALHVLSDGAEAPSDAWWRSQAGNLAQLLVAVVFVALEASKHVLSVRALNGKSSVPVQAFIVLQGAGSLLVATLLALGVAGPRGLRAAYSPWETWRCLPVAVGFSLSQTALARAYSGGLGAATVVVLGMLYMPLCAFLSRWVFFRHYGWLEIHALAFLTFSTMIFTELQSRDEGIQHSTQAVIWSLSSTVASCGSSLFGERVLKAKYTPRMPLQPFYVQKVWLEAGGLVVSLIAFAVCVWIEGWQAGSTLWQEWDGYVTASLATRVAQSWMAGLLAKHLSTVARAVIQSTALLVVFAWTAVLQNEKGESHLPETFLAIIVALSALMYQMGRKMTDGSLREGGQPGEDPAQVVLVPQLARSISDPTWRSRGGARRAWERSVLVRLTFLDGDGALLPDAHALAPREFGHAGTALDVPEPLEPLEPEPEARPEGDEGREGPCTEGSDGLDASAAPQRNWMVDNTWLVEARQVNNRLASWISTRMGQWSQFLCVLTFILADASRTLIYSKAISTKPIVPQSVVLTMSISSIPIGAAISFATDGWEGLRASASLVDAVRCLPVAACFSLGSTLQVQAYGEGISASVNTVLGYFYMPLSALLSRWVFHRAYGTLEWLALTLLSLASIVFVLLQQDQEGSKATSTTAIFCCFGSVVTSCIASLFSEKIMKSRPYPFYTQKVHLEVGGLLTAFSMLFVVGYLNSDKKPNDAFWHPRDVGGGNMQSGIFVGWDYLTFLTLLATILQSWLGGLVSKRLSTVVRSVAQCMSLLIIYFFGDLVLDHKQFDWVVGASAIVVALSVQVFTLAGQRRPGREGSSARVPPTTRQHAPPPQPAQPPHSPTCSPDQPAA